MSFKSFYATFYMKVASTDVMKKKDTQQDLELLISGSFSAPTGLFLFLFSLRRIQGRCAWT